MRNLTILDGAMAFVTFAATYLALINSSFIHITTAVILAFLTGLIWEVEDDFEK